LLIAGNFIHLILIVTPILDSLNENFVRLHENAISLVHHLPMERLYWRPQKMIEGVIPTVSCGEAILRAAAVVEQTFGGITSNLWDDPLEWTLPETLSTPARIENYLGEVEQTRKQGFALINTDSDLIKEIFLPSGEKITLFKLLMNTISRSAHYQGQALAIFSLFSESRPFHKDIRD
jgi:hypothetical protein